jgi:hypothetical protein
LHFSLLTDYPWYFFLFCLLLGAGVSYLTYFRNTITEKGNTFGWPVWLLMLLRFLSISILSFLLLAPVVKSIFKKVEKPIIVLAMDNSQSILLNKDSAYYKNTLPAEIEKLKESLGDKYDLHTFTFGSKLDEKEKLTYKEKQTDLSGAFDEIYSRFYNQNIGAVVTLTDGIYNQGQNPLYTMQRFNTPVYTVAMGDTTPPRDLLIKNVRYNQIVYSGNSFPLQIQVRSKGFKGKDAQLTVSNHGNTVFRESVHIANDRFYKEIEAKIDAKSSGMQRYHIELSRFDNEAGYANNQYDVFIDVLNSKKKILIVAQDPHPDVSAIKKSIERNQFYEVDALSYGDFQKNIGLNATKLRNYQLVILHQLPGSEQNASQLTTLLKENEIPALYILGNQSSLGIFNSLDAGVQIQAGGARANEATGSINPGFTMFTTSDELAKNLPLWPPLSCPFGEYRVADKQNIFLYQQIGRIRSDMPLLLFTKNNKQKTGILCGEGIWKWFILDYATNQNFKASDEIIDKTIQYLSVKTDNRLFRVRPSRNLFYEDDRISFESEVYNESYEPVKDAAVQMTIKNEAGKSFDFTFQPRGTTYFLDAGFMPSGVYTYHAQTLINKKNYALDGEFIVNAIDLEFLETQANHQLLNSIARQQGGKMIYPRQLSQLTHLLDKREDIHSVAYMQTDLKELIHFKWVFFIILALLSAEWFLRKYFGTY